MPKPYNYFVEKPVLDADDVTWGQGEIEPRFLIIPGVGVFPLGEMTERDVRVHFTIHDNGDIERHVPIDYSSWRKGDALPRQQ